jgi:hypothetical protein
MAIFSCYFGLERQDLLFTELGFHKYFEENEIWKLLENFKRDPTVGSKVMVLFS